MPYLTLSYHAPVLTMVDQRYLPVEERYNEYHTYLEVAEAIRSMVVRGAPAIGIAAAYGVVLGARELAYLQDFQEFSDKMKLVFEVLGQTRPTAVNLFWALERMAGSMFANSHLPIGELVEALELEAIALHEEDCQLCRDIGHHGAALLEDGQTVLTHCNAGALATGDYGTALGVIRGAIAEGKHIAVYADETRPFLQGSRLTAWELQRDGIPVTLITDNMAAAIMSQGKIQRVIVGADRIAANGDTANKIGTLGVAILAKHYGIPFTVAAPRSTIDMSIADGSQIPIEQRNPREVTHIGQTRLAPEGISVENPAFDVTPAALIDSIVTEVGVLRAPFTEAIAAIMAAEKR